ncbi:MAG: PHP domain-containing protein [Limnochordia bacterium]|nr:PHP domain-containing protein [Limnochordia bacterium]
MSPKEKPRCDLHIHSCLSPCADLLMTPGNIIQQAVKLGLDCIAITDHNSAGNIQVALQLAKAHGIKLIPAMEIETREEVHLLCYFPSLGALLEWEAMVYENLRNFKNDEALFGHQLLTDMNDEYMAKEDRLLAMATQLSLSETMEKVTKLGGVVVPAHVDRSVNSILGQLGFIPPDAGIRVIEISRNTDPVDFLRIHPHLNHFRYIQSSDSHYLTEIGRCGGAVGCMMDEELCSLIFRPF